ncbi:hypothetical protein BpHYR1_022943 [Brachionus plicatilis]|uniref:Uncharacterized protein n=1 Tax=Brachionus plicatilis TaxID=10195 RepID=A0A3M7PQ17_BRAPC|nr:hypothetical protein BpHYR1_022943 [Brachionus plicatilis]
MALAQTSPLTCLALTQSPVFNSFAPSRTPWLQRCSALIAAFKSFSSAILMFSFGLTSSTHVTGATLVIECGAEL